jgi:hypothetical protein
MSYVHYLCLFSYSGVQHILSCVFALFVSIHVSSNNSGVNAHTVCISQLIWNSMTFAYYLNLIHRNAVNLRVKVKLWRGLVWVIQSHWNRYNLESHQIDHYVKLWRHPYSGSWSLKRLNLFLPFPQELRLYEVQSN